MAYQMPQVPPVTAVMTPPNSSEGPPMVCALSFGPTSQTLICPYCNSRVTTHLETKATAMSFIVGLLLAPSCCCWYPYVTKLGYSTDHRCPSCNTYLGAYRTN